MSSSLRKGCTGFNCIYTSLFCRFLAPWFISLSQDFFTFSSFYLIKIYPPWQWTNYFRKEYVYSFKLPTWSFTRHQCSKINFSDHIYWHWTIESRRKKNYYKEAAENGFVRVIIILFFLNHMRGSWKYFLMPFMFISMSVSLFFAGMVSAEPYTVKGDQLGMSLTEYEARHKAEEKRGSLCSDRKPSISVITGTAIIPKNLAFGIVECRKWHSFSTLAWEKVHFTFYFVSEKPEEPSTGKLGMADIRFDHNSYPIILAALSEKFGVPDTQEKKVLQNKMGAKFDMVVSQWKNETGEITLTEFYNSLDWSDLLFTHNKLSSLMEKRMSKAQNKKALDDI